MESMSLVVMSSPAPHTKCLRLSAPTKWAWMFEKCKHYARKRVVVSCHSGRIWSEMSEGGLEIDRRRLLLSSSTLGLSALTAGKSLAQPFPPPDLSNCVYPTTLPANAVVTGDCCPPFTSATEIVDFVFPKVGSPRTRVPAHLVDDAYMKKYSKAIEMMKKLDKDDPDDPRGFTQQAKIHCAYCNGAYLVGTDKRDYEVHGTWFFAPFHRWYMYFYERILAKLINDDTFALPFWNWDTAEGMTIPPMFTHKDLSIYNENRDACHQPSTIINLDEFTSCESGSVSSNYAQIYSHMISGSGTTALFHGDPYRFDSTATAGNAGNLESMPHIPIHVWAGSADVDTHPNREDMGSLYSAGRDPLFYCHHANVDRMWHIWNSKLGGKNYQDPDLLNSEFLFYDENKNLVRVKAGDCYDIRKLGYEYQKVDLADLPWLNTGRSLKKAGTLKSKPTVRSFKESPNKPSVLTGPVTVRVKRPTQKRSSKEKEEAEEILGVEGIELDTAESSKFSVYLNFPDATAATGADSPHYAGTFAFLGHGKEMMQAMTTTNTSMKKKFAFKVGITETLEDIGASEDEIVTVTLVPQATKYLPKTPIKFSAVKIAYDNK